MTAEGLRISSTAIQYLRDSRFSYTCHACSRCCHDKIIQLNPYEVARLRIDMYCESTTMSLPMPMG